jgi:uncharacterized protein (DUF427 family)
MEPPMARPIPIPPGPGQESVWDYPRPPRIEQTTRRIRVVFIGITIAETRRALRVLETSHPPVYYLPPEDVRMEYFTPASNASFCEWKGRANYYDLTVGNRREPAVAWTYHTPTARFAPLANYLAVYPGKMDACYVDDERATPQPGGFYGGWVTADIVGPFKGELGTMGW